MTSESDVFCACFLTSQNWHWAQKYQNVVLEITQRVYLCVESGHWSRSQTGLCTWGQGIAGGRGPCVGGAGCGTARAGAAQCPARGAAGGGRGAHRGAGADPALSTPSPESSEPSPWRQTNCTAAYFHVLCVIFFPNKNSEDIFFLRSTSFGVLTTC